MFFDKVLVINIFNINSDRGTQREFLENICLEEELRSKIFGTFVVKFLACYPRIFEHLKKV